MEGRCTNHQEYETENALVHSEEFLQGCTLKASNIHWGHFSPIRFSENYGELCQQVA